MLAQKTALHFPICITQRYQVNAAAVVAPSMDLPTNVVLQILSYVAAAPADTACRFFVCGAQSIELEKLQRSTAFQPRQRRAVKAIHSPHWVAKPGNTDDTYGK